MIPTLFLCKAPIANTHFVTIETLESFSLSASLDVDWSSFHTPAGLASCHQLYHTVCNCSNIYLHVIKRELPQRNDSY